jgi:hypothetical protein
MRFSFWDFRRGEKSDFLMGFLEKFLVRCRWRILDDGVNLVKIKFLAQMQDPTRTWYQNP